METDASDDPRYTCALGVQGEWSETLSGVSVVDLGSCQA